VTAAEPVNSVELADIAEAFVDSTLRAQAKLAPRHTKKAPTSSDISLVFNLGKTFLAFS